jgi:two-component system sensor histidine kinase ChvG
MPKFAPPRLRFSIRFKLLLVASSLLIIPIIGTNYIREMEDYLRQQQEEALLTRTQMVAAVFQGKPDLFKTQSSDAFPTRGVQHVLIRPLHTPIQLDGYLDDWAIYRDRMQLYSLEHAVKGSEPGSLSFYHQLGSYGKYVYAVFQVKDDHIVYRAPNSLRIDQADHLLIVMEDKLGQVHRYIISTLAPGWVNAYIVSDNPQDPIPLAPEVRIKGEWQETTEGYNIEIRIPISMLGNRLSFAIADVDDPVSRQVDTVISTAGIDDGDSLGTIMFPSQEAEAILERLKHPLMRTWVIDKQNRVIARIGSLTPDPDEQTDDEVSPPTKEPSLFSGLMTLFYKLILKQPASEFQDVLLNASRLDSAEFREAMAGKPATRWRQTPDKQATILTAAYPVYKDKNVIGAVAIEQTSNAILLVQNQAMEILFNLSALAFLIACTVLLVFATRLSQRIRRLRDTSEAAITPDGRVVGEIRTTRDSDEIGDLSRSVANMLERLAQYNRYLESMASKLSHELRTPITVVKSSLDNLNPQSNPQEIETYTQRAREGIERLNNLLTRMSEATRLEQTLQSEQLSRFDLYNVVQGCVEGYRLAHSAITFDCQCHAGVIMQGVPDLMAQMLDKLINNAIDFHAPNTPILVKLDTDGRTITLLVSNSGPALPDEMQGNLFESMVSIRHKKGEQPHLGLGLYIVRLIAEFHHGSVSARNRSDHSGAEFLITLSAV